MENKCSGINPSSLINLKAELHKKYDEFKRKKNIQNPDPPKRLLLKTKKQISDQKQKISSIEPKEDNEEIILEKSRKALEAKAKFYEQITSKNTLIDDEFNDHYLVDFQRKILYNENEIEVESKRNENNSQLPKVVANIEVPKPKSSATCTDENRTDEAVHYQNIQFNEIRDHGTGYFAFSTDEKKRKEQMEELNSLRQQTEHFREVKHKLLTVHQEKLKTRLAKVCERRSIDQSVVQNYTSKEEKSEKLMPDSIDISSIPLPEDEKLEKEIKKDSKIRPWDIGKELNFPTASKLKIKDQYNWIEERRNERNEEFAPPSFYVNI